MLRAGDIAACYGRGPDAAVIRLATAWPIAPRGLRLGPSHVAIMAETSGRGLLWFESTSLCQRPCVLTGEQRAGTQAHWPNNRIFDYTRNGGRVDIYRLLPFWELLPGESRELGDLLRIAVDLRLRYDLPGALLSGTRVLKFSRFFYADLESVFCSELVAAVLQKLHLLAIQNPMRFSPASLMRSLVRTGVYRRYATYFRGGVAFEPGTWNDERKDGARCVAA